MVTRWTYGNRNNENLKMEWLWSRRGNKINRIKFYPGSAVSVPLQTCAIRS